MTDWLTKIKQTKALADQIELRPTKKNIARCRRVAVCAEKLAWQLWGLLQNEPGAEQWWQQERLQRGIIDKAPTLYVYARWSEALADAFEQIADDLESEWTAKQASRKR